MKEAFLKFWAADVLDDSPFVYSDPEQELAWISFKAGWTAGWTAAAPPERKL